VFRGEPYRGNLCIVEALERFAQIQLGAPVSRLAVAWEVANPAVHIPMVGTLNPKHIEDAMAAAHIKLDASTLRPIEDMVNDEVPVGGPTSESV